MQSIPELQPLWKILSDTSYKVSLGSYLSLAGFVLFTFYLSVLLPDLMRRYFPLKGKKLLAFRTVIIALICLGAYISLFGSILNPSRLPKAVKWMSPARFGMLTPVRYINLCLIPFSLFLIMISLAVPALLRIFKKGPGRVSVKAKKVRKGLAFYGLLAATALLVTGVSAALLGAASAFYPNAVSFVNGMEGGLAEAASGIFLTIVMAPVVEETAFRGLIQHHLGGVLPAGIAIVSAAVFFGLWHWNLAQFIYTFVWGVLFGIVYSATGKVRHTILLHALGNLFAVLAYSTKKDAVFGKRVVLPAVRSWLMNLQLIPAVLIFLLFAALIFAAMETALWTATGKENRFICLIKKAKREERS